MCKKRVNFSFTLNCGFSLFMGLFGGFRSSFGGLFGGFFSFRRFTFWGFRSGSVIVEGTIDVDDETQGDLAVASLQNAQELMGFPVLAMSSSRVGVEPAAWNI